MTSSNTLPHGINSVPIVSPRNTSIPHPLPHHIAGKNHGNIIDTKQAITTPKALSSLSFYILFTTLVKSIKINEKKNSKCEKYQ